MIGVVVGFAVGGLRAGRFMVGVSLLPARTAWEAAWPQLQARSQAAFEAAFDDALAGPLTEHVARSLGEHRVIERIADELIANGTVTALFDQALQAGLAEQIADRLLAPDVLDSPLLLQITDRVMASEEMQRVIAHIASSPELRTAMAEQSSGVLFWTLAGQTPGMRLMALRVVNAAGDPPGFGKALVRFAGLVLAAIPFCAGFVPILFDERRRGLQDMLAGTVVLYAPKTDVLASAPRRRVSPVG